MSRYQILIALWMAAMVLLFVGAVVDWRKRIIPNRIVGLVAADGLVLGLLSRPERIWLSVVAALVVLVGLGFLAHFRLIGGGDVKLVSAATLLVPPDRIGLLLLAISLVGGVISLGYLAAYYGLTRSPAHGARIHRARKLRRLFARERSHVFAATSVPYGVAVFGGFAIVTVSEVVTCFFATSCSL